MLLLGLLRRSERTWHGLALSGQSIKSTSLMTGFCPTHTTPSIWRVMPHGQDSLRRADGEAGIPYMYGSVLT